ncbi:hypothetical protein EUGRSUZ_K01181 [Eucalyptus grandis]|uniref:Uncharacterized protein n=2 Tax=Eucalyptus grandis TaxID=71139 RepID=A0ACC3ITU7_EUCGR|nr:hypothetical protein EUGRSUZ_K01181 [Eucalyptus grandis]
MLELTSEGDLILKDADGTVAWSTNTSGKSVVSLNLTDLGNLVLFDKNNLTVWQSFSQPTDSLVPGQMLKVGQRLIPRVSGTNWTVDGMITLSMSSSGLSAQMETSPPQIYYEYSIDNPNASNESPYVEFVNGSLALFSNSTTNVSVISVPQASSVQYMKVGSDGHLRVFEWVPGWKEVADLLTGYLGDCAYPTVCGQYGICSNGQCSCPASSGGTSYFKQVDNRQPSLGCSENVPLSYLDNIDASTCKETCMKNSSCKAAIFQFGLNPTSSNCYLLSEMFSLMNIDKSKIFYNSTAYLKVQNVTKGAPNTSVDNRRSNRLPVILGSSVGALFVVMFLIVVTVLFVRKRDANEAEEEYLDQGTLFDSTKVAVKHLDGFGQVEKSFLAEVETIGSIHHVNLVRLVGFCAEKSHRLLIYEYMPNECLDKWIFHKSNKCVLDWKQRNHIILDFAKGLNYLQEDCKQKILHLDIKPQNMLLDGNFNAKIADFGLSKLIDRDQSQVITTMRGIPGYLAPEWLSVAITEKVDVYSGLVILEIVCGRRIFDHSLDQEDIHLPSLFKRKAKEEQLLDIVD